MKQVEIVQSDMNGDIDVDCVFTPGSGTFGQASVDDSLMASHTQGTANDVFTLEDGLLKVEGVQGIYGLEEGNLYAYSNVTASAKVFTEIPNKVVSFQYNAEGLRTKKTMTLLGRVTETEYILHGKLVTEMIVRKYDEADPTEITEENSLHFFYDAQSRPAMVTHNGQPYRYLHNLQGDITGILDSNGNAVVQYRYDAWGKPLSTVCSLTTELASLNPFRYRAYVFDGETGLYYLRSRYYYPILMRFLCADELIGSYSSLVSHNLYDYCLGSPLSACDENGHSIRSVFEVIAIVVALVKAAEVIIPAIGAEIQLVVNRAKAKQALSNSAKKQTDYLANYPYGGAEAAFGEGILGKLEWFYGQVNHDAPMDYKRPWRRPWWSLGCDTFFFRGKMISFEEYGNINYGYVGKALGIWDWVIYAGGGYAAVTRGGDTSGNIGYFFDSERDHDNIAWGISIYKDMWGND